MALGLGNVLYYRGGNININSVSDTIEEKQWQYSKDIQDFYANMAHKLIQARMYEATLV